MQQSRIFVGMVLILIFGEVLGLYGYAAPRLVRPKGQQLTSWQTDRRPHSQHSQQGLIWVCEDSPVVGQTPATLHGVKVRTALERGLASGVHPPRDKVENPSFDALQREAEAHGEMEPGILSATLDKTTGVRPCAISIFRAAERQGTCIMQCIVQKGHRS